MTPLDSGAAVTEKPRALIVGGTGGIGRCLVEGFVDAGYDVVSTYHSNRELADAMAERFCGRVVSAHMDLSNAAGVQAAFDASLGEGADRWFDTVVLAAGLAGQAQMLARGKAERVVQLAEVNFTGQICLVQAILKRLMVRSAGRTCSLIAISSTSAVEAQPGMSVYAASKAGMEQFFKCCAAEYAKCGLRFNTVRSGPLMTDMIGALPEKTLEALKARLDGNAIPTPDRLTAFVLFLAQASLSKGMNGSVLHVDHGYSLSR
jgi:NAD(P)-dependent dehydrogenase (short-subunit alcohol dehydrogenase family)